MCGLEWFTLPIVTEVYRTWGSATFVWFNYGYSIIILLFICIFSVTWIFPGYPKYFLSLDVWLLKSDPPIVSMSWIMTQTTMFPHWPGIFVTDTILVTCSIYVYWPIYSFIDWFIFTWLSVELVEDASGNLPPVTFFKSPRRRL